MDRISNSESNAGLSNEIVNIVVTLAPPFLKNRCMRVRLKPIDIGPQLKCPKCSACDGQVIDWSQGVNAAATTEYDGCEIVGRSSITS